MEPTSEADLFRDTPVRYLGYTNEIGEAFRPLIHRTWVNLSYAAASTYVLADVIDKALKVHKDDDLSNNNKNKQGKLMAAAFDTLAWQAFASIIIPGFTINRLCAASYFILKKTTKLPKVTRKWSTTAIGLTSIPFIIKPIDRLVDYSMDNTVRKLYN